MAHPSDQSSLPNPSIHGGGARITGGFFPLPPWGGGRGVRAPARVPPPAGGGGGGGGGGKKLSELTYDVAFSAWFTPNLKFDNIRCLLCDLCGLCGVLSFNSNPDL